MADAAGRSEHQLPAVRRLGQHLRDDSDINNNDSNNDNEKQNSDNYLPAR